MTLVISENEMIYRFGDGLKLSISKAGEFIKTPKDSNKPELFLDFLGGLKVAAGSAHQLAHARMDTRWLDLRDILEKVLDLGKEIPVSKADDGEMWLRIAKSLVTLSNTGFYLANNTKAQKRADTLAALTTRETAVRLDESGS